MAKWVTLAPDYQENRGLTHKLILTYADVVLMTSGTAYSIIPNSSRAMVTAAAATTLPAGTMVKQAYGKITTAFVGTGTLVAILGDGGDTDRLIASQDLKTAAFMPPRLALLPNMFTAADTIDITVTAGTDITTFTAGEVEFYFEIFDPVALTNPRSSVG